MFFQFLLILINVKWDVCSGCSLCHIAIFFPMKVNEGHEEPEKTSEEVSTDCHPSVKGHTSNGPPDCSDKLAITKPNNAYEFGQVINAVSSRKDKEACAHLLAITEPKDLPVLLSNKLEGDIFLLLIQSLKNNLIDKDPSLVYQHLLYLSKAERFKVSSKILIQIDYFRVSIL